MNRVIAAPYLILSVLVGVVIGIGGYAFVYAKGYSYLLDDPAACANCHAMTGQYDAWIKSTHRQAATCNDCHTPHNILGKYAVKASNGFFHSFYFTTGAYPDNISITNFDRKVTEGQCRRCHSSITEAIDANVVHGEAEGLLCTRCHYAVGHASAATAKASPILNGTDHEQ